MQRAEFTSSRRACHRDRVASGLNDADRCLARSDVDFLTEQGREVNTVRLSCGWRRISDYLFFVIQLPGADSRYD